MKFKHINDTQRKKRQKTTTTCMKGRVNTKKANGGEVGEEKEKFEQKSKSKCGAPVIIYTMQNARESKKNKLMIQCDFYGLHFLLQRVADTI